MNEDERQKINLTLQKLETLDYFQILGVDEQTPLSAIKIRFYSEAQKFHPDNFFTLDDPGLKAQITTIYKRISEAYSILSDPKTRLRYTQLLKEDRTKNLRYSIQDEEKIQREARKAQEEPGKTPQANKYFKLAMTALKEGKPQSAQVHIAMALKQEPENASFAEWKKKIDGEITEQKRKDSKESKADPYKIGKR